MLAVTFVFLAGFAILVPIMKKHRTEESMNWVLMATPILLLFAVKWLSSVENPERLFGFGLQPWERRRRSHMYYAPSEGSSPWGVALLILVLLVLLQYQSTFQDRWFGG